MSYVYVRSERTLWTVGFYKPDGIWESESDHDSPDEAADRVAYLNGATILAARHHADRGHVTPIPSRSADLSPPRTKDDRYVTDDEYGLQVWVEGMACPIERDST